VAPTSGDLGKAVVVHSLDQARAALRAATERSVPVILLSGPAAAGYAGPAWFRELVATARAEVPAAEVTAVLDCGDAPGHALAALRAGLAAIRFDGPRPVAERIADIAGQYGASVERGPRAALDLEAAADPYAACLAWLDGAGARP
jgi:fructose/tagatose bisphosphate aldolase